MPILDQFGNPITSTRRPDTNPLAASRILDSDRQYVTSGLTPATLAGYFREADAGDITSQAHLFEQISERDGHLIGETGKRKNVITDVNFQFTPSDDSQRALDISEFCEKTLKNIAEWPDVLVLLQDAVGKGFSCPEVSWDVSSGQAVPYDFKQISPWRFRFTEASGYLSQTPLLLDDEHLMGAPIPSWKVLFHRHNALSGNATRNGIYRICAWMFLFKNYSIKDWLTFAEVYGMPLRLGLYPPGASADDKSALKRAVHSLGSDAEGIISNATEIKFIESIKGKDGGELFHAIINFADKEMSKALLGTTQTGDTPGTGSYAADFVKNEVRLDLVKADSRAIAATVRDQLIRPMVGFNFGWDAALPGYAAVWDEDDDLKSKAEWADKILKYVSVPAKWLREEFKIPEAEKGEEMVGGPGNFGSGNADFGAASAKLVAKSEIKNPNSKIEPDAADLFEARLNREAEPVLSKMLETVRDALNGAASLEEFRDKIFDLYPDIDTRDMADLMTNAALAADLAGRYEVDNGN